MKLFNFATYEDYGTEYFLQILLFYPKFALLDILVQWDEYPASEIFPMILLSIGSRSLCGFSIRWRWLQVKVDLIDTCPRNLKYYQNKLSCND